MSDEMENSSSDRMVGDVEQPSKKHTGGCLQSRTLKWFFVTSILLNFLLVSLILGLLLTKNLMQDDDTSIKPSSQTVPEDEGSTPEDMDQICVQCDPGEGNKINLMTVYPFKNTTDPLCCKKYDVTKSETTSTDELRFSIIQPSFRDNCQIPGMQPLPAGLVFLDYQRCTDGDMYWTQFADSYIRGGVTLTYAGSRAMLGVPEDGLYVVYSDLEFRGGFATDSNKDKTTIHVHSLVKYPRKVIQMHRFTLRQRDIKKSAAIAVINLQAGDKVFVAVDDLSYIYDDSEINRFGVYKLQ